MWVGIDGMDWGRKNGLLEDSSNILNPIGRPNDKRWFVCRWAFTARWGIGLLVSFF